VRDEGGRERQQEGGMEEWREGGGKKRKRERERERERERKRCQSTRMYAFVRVLLDARGSGATGLGFRV